MKKDDNDLSQIARDSESKTLIAKKLEHKIEIENFDKKNYYRCCCSDKLTDRRVLEYLTKVGISFGVLIFSFTMIVKNDDPCSPLLQFYTGLISLIIGVFIKNPTIEK